MKKIKLSHVLFVLFAIQPLLDVLSYWTQESSGTLTLALRLLMLLGVLTFGYVHSERKWIYYTAAAACVAFYALHAFACWRAGGFTLSAVLTDGSNYVRVVQFPLMVLAIASMLKADRAAWRGAEDGCMAALSIIALVALLSRLTGTDPTTYHDKQIGVLGWFYFANSQSSILSALAPIAICAALRRGKWFTILVPAMATTLLFLLGTRLAYAAAIATAIAILISLRLCGKQTTLRRVVLLVCAVACAAGYFVSPMRRNLDEVADNAYRKQRRIDSLVATGRELYPDDEVAALSLAYEDFLPGLMHRYGAERVISYYDYSTSATELCDVRQSKRTYCEMLLQDSPWTSRLFGLNYAEMYYDDEVFDVENDMHGIVYLYGWAGLALFLLLIAYMVWRIVRALLADAKYYFTMDAATCGIAFCSLLAHAYFTAGLLRRPNASIYLSLVLAAIYAMTQKKPETLPQPHSEI